MEERKQINILQGEDTEVFERIFNEYYHELLSFASHYLWDNDAAKDIVQEVFIRLYENRENYKITSLKSYLFSSVKNRCLNYLRDYKVRDSHKAGMAEALLWSNAVIECDEEALLEWLHEMVSKMPEGCRNVVQLRISKGLKFAEIAKQLQITENNAKVQMSRAVSFLRNMYKKTTGGNRL